jgi:hypothetical protein
MADDFKYDVFLSHSSKIVFEGKRFEVMSVRRWRDKALSERLP